MADRKELPSDAEVRLRTLAPEDFDAIYEIDQVCYPPQIAYSRRELSWYLRLPGAEGIVAEVGGRIVGFLVAAYEKSAAHIVTIDVLEEHRRRAIGTALLREAEERLGRKGVTLIQLETAVDNAAAVAFWKSHGYQSRGILRNYYPGGLNAYAMMKSLATISPETLRRSSS
ncbi:MAG: N-acetyltransferase [Candidatus Acidiferrales bacterium]